MITDKHFMMKHMNSLFKKVYHCYVTYKYTFMADKDFSSQAIRCFKEDP